MVDFEIYYNVFTDELSLKKDGVLLGNAHCLSEIQYLPFYQWCSRLFSLLYKEANSEYSCKYIGRECEFMLLENFSNINEYCKSFEYKSPCFNNSMAARLKRLDQICLGQVRYETRTHEVIVYSDVPEDYLLTTIHKYLPKLSFCILTVLVQPLEKVFEHNSSTPIFIIIQKQDPNFIKKIIAQAKAETYILLLTNRDAFIRVDNKCFIEEITDVSKKIKNYLELRFFVDVLKLSLELVQINKKSIDYRNFLRLSKFDREIIINFPLCLELGKKENIHIKTFPQNETAEEVIFSLHDCSVLEIKENVIIPKCIGSTKVYACNKSGTLLDEFETTVVKRNKIKKINFQMSQIDMCIGETFKAEYNFKPYDADNIFSIQLKSFDGTIVGIQDNILRARNEGTTEIIVQAEDNISASCRVTVYPKLKIINATLAEEEIFVGDLIGVETRRFPQTATLNKLSYTVQPPEIGLYDVALGSIMAKTPGSGTLIITDDRSSLTFKKDFVVSTSRDENLSTLIKYVLPILIIPFVVCLGCLIILILINIS